MAVFWVVAIDDRPDDGGSKDFWNVGKLLPDYTALQPRRQQSSYSPTWEPQILLSLNSVLFAENETVPQVCSVARSHSIYIVR
jgi:hypothetical protein